MRRIPDYGLIEVAYLDVDNAFDVGNWPEVPCMAITAYPNIRSSRNRRLNRFAAKPFIELNCISTNLGMGRCRHLGASALVKYRFAICGCNGGFQ